MACSTSAGFQGASRWCKATRRFWTLVPMPIFCVLPIRTPHRAELRTFSNRACFLASESASPMAASCARGMPRMTSFWMISS